MPVLPTAPAGYQLIASAKYGYVVAIPDTWVYLNDDSDVPLDDQVATIEDQFPALEPIVESQKVMLGTAKLLLFDPVGAAAHRVMTGNLLIMGALPATNLQADASAAVKQIAAVYNLKSSQIVSKVLDLPGGPTIQLSYSMTISGAAMKLVQYMIYGAEHTYVLTFGSTSGAWATYQAVFARIAEGLTSI
jgi:hypothetical protein